MDVVDAWSDFNGAGCRDDVRNGEVKNRIGDDSRALSSFSGKVVMDEDVLGMVWSLGMCERKWRVKDVDGEYVEISYE